MQKYNINICQRQRKIKKKKLLPQISAGIKFEIQYNYFSEKVKRNTISTL